MTGRGTGMTRWAARQPPAAGLVRLPPVPPAGRAEEPSQCDGQDAEDFTVDLDARIAEMVAAAPPLSSRQRDALALLLRRRAR